MYILIDCEVIDGLSYFETFFFNEYKISHPTRFTNLREDRELPLRYLYLIVWKKQN